MNTGNQSGVEAANRVIACYAFEICRDFVKFSVYLLSSRLGILDPYTNRYEAVREGKG